MISTLDPYGREEYTQPIYDPYGHTPVDGMSTTQQVTPIDQNPVQPPGWTEPVRPEQGSPQLSPITTTTTSGPTVKPTNIPQPGPTPGPIYTVQPPSTGGGGTTPPVGPGPVTGPGGTMPDGTQVPTYGFGGLVGLDFMRQVTPNELVSNQINNLTAGNSQYMQNARRRGAEYAGSRGNINSSIGAGSAMRASLEAGLPIAQQDAATYASANTQNADALNQIRQSGVNSFLSQNDALFNAQSQDWLANNQFNRQFNGQLALLPIANAADMWSGLMDLAASNPMVFTPTVLAGYQDFFQQGFNNYIGQYLAGPSAPAAGGGP